MLRRLSMALPVVAGSEAALERATKGTEIASNHLNTGNGNSNNGYLERERKRNRTQRQAPLVFILLAE